MSARISAVELAELLGSPNRPTPEQAAVIEAPLSPLLVVAGAGSGKTATMTDRVAWLVANRLVEPSQVLGLTFTRKAAGELAERVERQLARLSRALGTAPNPAEELLARPRVSTYNAYAAALVRDHGMLLGIEADQVLLTEAGRFQLALEVAEAWDGELEVDTGPAGVARAVVSLASMLAEHLLSPAQAAARLTALADELADAAPSGRRKNPAAPYAPVAAVIASLRTRAALMPLVERFALAKRERGTMDFPDQVAAAATLARRFPGVGARERDVARIVLLDEYQDTSVAQLAMLRALFGSGHPVTAVGDPHQGIYGWRGASAGALLSFPEHFPRGDGEPAPVASLSISWRNDKAILEAANRISAPLRQDAPVPVPPLEAREGAAPGEVVWTYAEDVAAEARAMAAAVAARWSPGNGTAAVLCRKRLQFAPVLEALRAAGLPAQVVGLAGLLHTPEVADVRAALAAAFDPTRGDALMRLLTGPAFQLGVSDLAALADIAKERTTARRGESQRVEDLDSRSIVEALDLPISSERPEPWRAQSGRSVSEEGCKRLGRAGSMLRRLRALGHLGLAEQVGAAERELGLDLELATRAGLGGEAAGAAARGRANLDAFAEIAAQFEAGTSGAGVGAFLSYLEAAEDWERGLEAAVAEPDPHSVQILTMHAAKGLEWDVVGVVGLTEEDFPGLKGSVDDPTSTGWTSGLTSLPYEFRGDADHLPALQLAPGMTHTDVRDALEAFLHDDGARELAEQRRLAYVAFTRARSHLVLTGSWWSTRRKPSAPSRFLRSVVEAGIAGALDGTAPGAMEAPPPDYAPGPPATATWPEPMDETALSTLERARARVREASVREASTQRPGAGGGEDADTSEAGDPRLREWRWQATVLLAERDGLLVDAERATEVQHLSASQVVALVRAPEDFARERRRPVPARPSPQSRRGTRFHSWLEEHYQRAALLDVSDLPDAGPGNPEGSDADVTELRRAFLASPWARREPLALEVDVVTPVAGVEIRCRIDAVFPPGPGEDCDVHIVDWKTGAPPTGARERRARELQLALYRLGWARLHGVALDRIAASFHYVAQGRTLSAAPLGEEELTALVARELAALRSQQ